MAAKSGTATFGATPLFLDGLESAAELTHAFASAPKWLTRAVHAIARTMDVQHVVVLDIGEANRLAFHLINHENLIKPRNLLVERFDSFGIDSPFYYVHCM